LLGDFEDGEAWPVGVGDLQRFGVSGYRGGKSERGNEQGFEFHGFSMVRGVVVKAAGETVR
jgi:hypothetical protein